MFPHGMWRRSKPFVYVTMYMVPFKMEDQGGERVYRGHFQGGQRMEGGVGAGVCAGSNPRTLDSEV